jgi:hypothetical protein
MLLSCKINNLSVMDLAQMINGLITAVKNNQIKTAAKRALFRMAMDQAVEQAFMEEKDDDN